MTELRAALLRLADAVHGVRVVDACPDQDIDGFSQAAVDAAYMELTDAETDARALLEATA